MSERQKGATKGKSTRSLIAQHLFSGLGIWEVRMGYLAFWSAYIDPGRLNITSLIAERYSMYPADLQTRTNHTNFGISPVGRRILPSCSFCTS